MMIGPRGLLLVCGPFLTLGLCAQQRSDSLQRVWADTTHITRQRIPALAELLDRDSTLDVARALTWVLPQGTDTASNAYQHQLGLAIMAEGAMQEHREQHQQALTLFQRSLAHLQGAGRPLDRTFAESSIGLVLLRMGRSKDAVDHQLRALAGYEAARDTFGIVGTRNDLAYSFSLQGSEVQSVDLYRQNLPLVRRSPDQEMDLMLRIAERYKEVDDRASTNAWLDSAERVIRTKGAVDREGLLHWIRGDMLLEDERCADALKEFTTCAAAIDQQPGNPGGKSWIRSRLATAHNCAKDYHAAVAIAGEGLALAEAHGLLKEQADNLFPLATAYEGLGDATEALRYFKRYHAVIDPLINTEAATRLTNAYLTADFEKRQFADSLATAQQREHDALLADQRLARQRIQRNVLLGVGLIAVIFAVVDYRQRMRIKRALQRSDELLLNILPAAVADELKAKGEAEAKQIDSVTVLFTDFKGFTTMSEQLTPKELVKDIHACFSAFDRIMERHGVEKIKTIGDSYMAAGGVPTPNTTHAHDVVLAALDVQAFIAESKARKVAQGLPWSDIRIGVHSGPVVAGIVGLKKFQYDIWGDTVNTASRMESSGEVGRVNISGATHALVKDEPGLVFTPRGKVSAKGKGELEMYYVDRAS